MFSTSVLVVALLLPVAQSLSVIPKTCDPVCAVFCPYGNVLDGNGCPTCVCKSIDGCGPTCEIYCPNGYVPGKNGCPTCKCKPSPCKKQCQRKCSTVNVDANGCVTCYCMKGK
ncbi:uncharacterized protein LOC141909040 [Tubulanus polymorphus]|uniref:uncharacterized protein LOC141909040 n=1 Tax=Tubulanus polymorphus TaxID=672921 RepID=UPI003DA36721